jgi:hypothetical protein
VILAKTAKDMVDYAREYFSKNMLKLQRGGTLLFDHTIM